MGAARARSGRAAAGGGGERRDAAARGGRAPAARRATLQTQTQTPNRRDAASHHRRHGARARRYPPTAASASFFEPLAPPSTASLRIPRERPPDAREGRVCVRSSACVRVCALAETRATNAARSDHRAWPQTDFHQPHPAKSRGRRSFGGNDAPRTPRLSLLVRLSSHKIPKFARDTYLANIPRPRDEWDTRDCEIPRFKNPDFSRVHFSRDAFVARRSRRIIVCSAVQMQSVSVLHAIPPVVRP